MTARLAGMLLMMAVASGCAATGPAELPAASAPAPTATAPVADKVAPAVRVVRPAAGAGAVTPPSPEALAVLATIPEPVPLPKARGRGAPSETPATALNTMAPPEVSPAAAAISPVSAAAPGPDSSTHATVRGGVTAASDTASAPVPAPTTPLGAGLRVMPPTPDPPVVAAPPAPVVSAPAAPVAAGPDTCWRVQLGAPSERARGRMLADASQSLLLAPMTLMSDAGRWKVRTRDCISRAAAESLRDRAVKCGFEGAFLIRFVDRR